MDIGVSATLLGISATILTILITFHKYFSKKYIKKEKELWATIILCLISALLNIFGILFTEFIYTTSILSSIFIFLLMVWIIRILRIRS